MRHAMQPLHSPSGLVVGMARCVPLLALLAGPAAAATVIDTDFGSADREALSDGQRLDRVTGVLPAGWSDNSSWARVWVDYRRLEEAGRAFLRVNVTKVEYGNCQLVHALPRIEGESFFRLVLIARSSTRASAELGVRLAGAPYSFLWSTAQTFGADWQELSFEFRLEREERDVGFFVVLGTPGVLDIAHLRLDCLAREAYIAELEARHRGGPRNLLRVSRFPLGMQSGWSLSRDSSDGDDVLVEPDASSPGPSGAPSLRLVSTAGTSLQVGPFAVPLAFAEHVASIHAKGQWKGRLAVVCDGRWLAQRELGAGADWRRIELPFKPVLMARAYSLRIEGSGDLRLDAFQVEPGRTAGPYSSQMPFEVSLACPGEAGCARVQFEDERPELDWCVTGPDAPGAVLAGRVVNVYGDEVPLAPRPLGKGFLRRGKLRYDAFAKRPRGAFRVEAWVECPRGTRASAPNELVVLRLRRPRYWMRLAPESPFGVHTNSTRRHVLMAKAVGANWTRLHDAGTEYIGWYHLEKRPGQWSFRDREIRRYGELGMKVLGLLSTAPPWASRFERPHNGYFDQYYQPKRLEDYANYVRTVVARYRGEIDTWDVWNEPWIHAWWPVRFDETKKDREGYVTSERPQADFAALVRTAREAAKAAEPSSKILGVNSTTSPPGTGNFGGDEWTKGFLEAGGLEHSDAVCYHDYIGGGPKLCCPGDAVETGFRRAMGPIIEKLGRIPLPVWMTEGSSTPGRYESSFYNHTLTYRPSGDPVDVADRLCRFVVSHLAQGVKKVFLYSMHCHSYFGQPAEYRVFVTEEGYPDVSAAAHSTMAWYLEDMAFVKRISPAENVTACLFEGGGRSVAVVAPAGGREGWVPPARRGLEIADLFGNPLAGGKPLGDTLLYVSGRMPVGELERLLVAQQ